MGSHGNLRVGVVAVIWEESASKLLVLTWWGGQLEIWGDPWRGNASFVAEQKSIHSLSVCEKKPQNFGGHPKVLLCSHTHATTLGSKFSPLPLLWQPHKPQTTSHITVVGGENGTFKQSWMPLLSQGLVHQALSWSLCLLVPFQGPWETVFLSLSRDPFNWIGARVWTWCFMHAKHPCY